MLMLLPLAMGSLSAQDARIDLRDWPVKVGPEMQLFVDDFLVAQQTGITFRLHQPEKYAGNPLITPSPDWERLVLCYGSILRDSRSGGFRMWYTNDTGIAYASSSDGLHWNKPPVGMNLGGHATNVLTKGHRGRSDTLTVLENPDRSDPSRRYLAFPFEYRYPDKDGVREQRREGIYMRSSPDGIHWTERPDPIMFSEWRNREDQPGDTNAVLSDVNEISWDAKLHRFMGYVKLGFEGVRTRGLTESLDAVHWSAPHLILRADGRDRPGDQIYSMIAFPYQSLWLGFIGLYHAGTDDRMDIQLVSSRDGRVWERRFREPFLPNGPEGAWDWGVLHMAANALLLQHGKLYIYYGGLGTRHNVKLRDGSKTGIGMAALRPDGFVSADAGDRPGILITRPLDFNGALLHLNAAVRPGGEIRVSVLDRHYAPVAGYVSLPVTGNGVDLPVRWSAAATLAAALRAGSVRLRFEMKDASLYGFRID
jgi:hypothetical protein